MHFIFLTHATYDTHAKILWTHATHATQVKLWHATHASTYPPTHAHATHVI